MNGYKLQAEAYKKVLEQDRENMAPEDIEVMEEKIKVFNILAVCSMTYLRDIVASI